MSALISAGAVPVMPADGPGLVAAADAMAPAGRTVGDRVADAVVAWGALPAVYDTPETSIAVSAMSPVSRAAADFADTAAAASAALRELGETLSGLEWTRSNLVGEVAVHRSQVLEYRSSDAALREDPGDPLAGWGPYGFSRNEDLLERCASLRRRFESALEQCEQELRRIGQPYGFASVVAAGSSTPAAVTNWADRNEQFHTTLGLAVLSRLAGVDEADVKRLLTQHPEWATLLRDSPPAPAAVHQWWAGLDAAASGALIVGAPAVIGSLGGVPAAARVDANRSLAEKRQRELKDLIDNRGYTYQTGTYERVRVPIPEAWQTEYDYLTRVIDGDVQLYLYDPDREQIIEMFGDPNTADVIMSFMPGTNTTMESFYSATDSQGITALTRWEVENAARGTATAGFVVKQGQFPQLTSDLFATGPQNNDMMEALGRAYAQFTFELNATAPGTPLVSVEHSAGSAAGGEAEMEGATFAARIPLAGIGMTDRWEAQDGVEYYAMQAADDINRDLDGLQAGDWGYAEVPSQANGFTELDSGIPGTPTWVHIATPLFPPAAIAGDLASGLEHHNQIISGGEDNRRVQAQLAQLLREAAG